MNWWSGIKTTKFLYEKAHGVYYRKANLLTRKEACPFPKIDDRLDTISGSRWFSTDGTRLATASKVKLSTTC